MMVLFIFSGDFLKWKKIGDILIVDNKFSDDSLDSLESIINYYRI